MLLLLAVRAGQLFLTYNYKVPNNRSTHDIISNMLYTLITTRSVVCEDKSPSRRQ